MKYYKNMLYSLTKIMPKYAVRFSTNMYSHTSLDIHSISANDMSVVIYITCIYLDTPSLYQDR
jgi:hypothetical protein